MKETHNRRAAANAAIATDRRPINPISKHPSIRGDGALKICAWCRRIPLGPNQWVHVEDALLTMQNFSRQMLIKATHGVCPECFRDFLAGRQTPKPSSANVPAHGRRLMSGTV